MKRKFTRKFTFSIVAMLLLLATMCGCTIQRNGQLFLSTLEDYHRVACPPTGDRWIFAFVDPFVYVGCFVGMFTVGPASDILFLPYDAYLSWQRGTKIAVVDENLSPIENVIVRVEYEGACLSSHGKTDFNGLFRTGIIFDQLSFGWASVEKEGFYPFKWFWRPTGGESSPLGNFNVQTAVLSRIERPISLKHREAFFLGESKIRWKRFENSQWRDLMSSGRNVSYDFVKGDWLPPFGRGVISDAVFVFKNDDGQSGAKVEVIFKGEGNGIVCANINPMSGVLMREAPIDGYKNSYMISSASRSKQTGLYFRIRGNVYGKICHDFFLHVYRGGGHLDRASKKVIYELPEEKWCTRVEFEYYLNTESQNRNLEQKKDGAYWREHGKSEP